MSIHRAERRLETTLRHLETKEITTQNRGDIKAFLSFIASRGCSAIRQCKYIYPLEILAKWLQKDFMMATKCITGGIGVTVTLADGLDPTTLVRL
jgi:hypothetical protein